ncbi:hypothetical protein GCM10010965_26060 [Caldalkalibacillus thermarum]|nr:hypothetical protein GCM10010965_26060 [Caldalkalibacillus thermarum]
MAPNGKCGVEHAKVEVIRQALAGARILKEQGGTDISWEQLVDFGLVAGDRARMLREKMGRHLGIGYGNAKQFYKRLQLFAITRAEFEVALEKVLKEVAPS